MRQIIAFLLLLIPTWLLSQQSSLLRDKDKDLRQGLELFDKEKFGAAQQYFNKIAEVYLDPHAEIRKNAEYYSAICAVELFNPDAEVLLTQFIYRHPESPLVKQAWFQLGKFFFRDKKYKKGEEWFRHVDPELLSDDEKEEFHFKSGYTHFKVDHYDQALKEFAVIKGNESSYGTTAAYYYAHIQYQNSNYEAALEDFLKLKDDEVFGAIVPFYISQIYYLQKRFDQVIQYAQPVLDSTQSKRGPEIARLIGESYYNTNRYREAIPYFETYRDKAGVTRTREDEYQIGFCYFKVNDFEKAIPAFQLAVGDQDALGQNAWYHLGWCQLQLGNKKFARSAWQQSAKTDFDTLIKEQALFDYAKLAYELGNDPYDEAVKALQDYINAYPNSTRMDDAYSFLVNIYATTHNYRTALQSLERIKRISEPLKSAYQRVAFFRGLELLNDKDYPDAIKHFDLSLKYPVNKEMAANANYWKADANYRKGDYAESTKGYEAFIYSLSAFNLKLFNRANYNLGYSYYKQRNYTAAITWFRKFVAVLPLTDSKLYNDAFLRIGDCFFMNKNYAGSVEYYDKALAIGTAEVDYALFQKGMALYVQGKLEAQVLALQKLINEHSNSRYADDAKSEISNSYLLLGRNDEAYAMYEGILLNHASSPLAPNAKVQMGLIRYNQHRDDEALKIYKEVLDLYPGTEEAKEAQMGIKKIYVEKGSVSEYQQLAQERGLETMSRTEFDSTAWEAAEKSYLKGDCDLAMGQMSSYLRDFPDGLFSLKALGYKADCEMKARKVDDAAQTYEKILLRPKNKYTAEAHLVLGIYERQKEEYPKAIAHFKELEGMAKDAEQIIQARSNIMRLSSKLGNAAEAEEYAAKVLETEKVQDDLKHEANLILARAALIGGKDDLAMEIFQKLRKINSEIGAESRYSIAKIYFNKGEYKRCEKAIFDLVDEMPSYDDWLAKGFILLADNYLKLGNVFQAKNTLQSVIDNHEGKELKDLAQRKLDEINSNESPGNKMDSQPDQEIEFQNNQKDDGLFEEKQEPVIEESEPKKGEGNE